jgi:hypothetical protein
MAQAGGVRIDPRFLPSLNDPAPEKKRSALGAGFSAGIDETQALLGSAAQGFGHMVGSPTIEAFGARVNERNLLEAEKNGRADLETAPWREGGAPVLPWLTYQTAKQIPLIAGYIGAGALVPEAAVPAALARAGAIAPRVLGGGGLRAGADFATRRAATEAGRSFGKTVVGAELAGLPIGFGSMYQEAASKPGGATNTDVIKAAGLSPIYASLDAIAPAQLRGLLARGQKGNIARRVIGAGLAGAAMEVPQEGIQTAMEVSFRPDMSTADKMTAIVDAAVTGGAVGGVFGGMGGLRRMKSMDAGNVTDEDLDKITGAALGLPAPQMFTDSAGRTAYGSDGGNRLRSTPLDPGEVQQPEFFDPEANRQIESQTIIQPKQGSLRWAQEYPQDDVSRPFRGFSDPELQSAVNALNKKGELNDEQQRILGLASDELALRVNQSATGTNSQSVTGAVERSGADVSGGADQTSSAPAPTFDTRLAEIKAQAGKTQFISQLNAANEDELVDKVHERLIVEGKGTLKEQKLGKLVGLLDDDGKPTALATQISERKAVAQNAASVATTPASAAPTSQEGGDQSEETGFQSLWREDLATHRGTLVNDLRRNPPKNRQEAQRTLYNMLGVEGGQDETVDGYKAVTKLAQEYGVIDKDGQLTEEGVQVARQALPLQLNAEEAMGRGYSGTEVSAFDRGARGDKVVRLGSIAELKAYNDGRDWAANRDAKNAPIPNVASSEATRKVIDEGTAQTVDGQVVRQAVTSAGIPAQQETQRWLNQAVDQVYGATLNPTEQAELKQLVRKGATGAEIDDAVRYMKSGRGALLRDQPMRKPYTGEVVTPGISNQRIRAELQLQRDEGVADRRQSLLSSAAALDFYNQEIAYDEANKTPRQRQREAIRAQLQALANEVEEEQALERETAEREMKVDKVGRLSANRSRFMDQMEPLQQDDAAMADAIRGADNARDRTNVALEYLADMAPNEFYRQLAQQMKTTVFQMRRAGWKFDVRVVGAGDSAPLEMLTSHGLTETEEDGTITVWLNDRTMSFRGTNYSTLAHEMTHAVTSAAIELGRSSADWGPRANAVKDLMEVTARIKDHFKALDPRELSEAAAMFAMDISDNWNNALENEHEIIAWALTDPRMQEYLNSIQYNPQQSFWSRLVEAIRNLLGLDAKHGSALEEVLRVAETLMQDSPHTDLLRAYLQEVGPQPSGEKITLGRRKTPAIMSHQMRAGAKRAIDTSEQMKRQMASSGGALRRAALPWATINDIAEHFGKWFDRERNGLTEYQAALSGKNAVVARMSQMLTDVRDEYQRLMRTDRASAEKIVQLMKLTEFGINPTKPWANQTAEVQRRTNLKPMVDEAHKIYKNTLVRKGTAKVYNDLRTVNDVLMLSQMAVTFFHQTVNDPLTGAKGTGSSAIPGFANDPMDDFMAEQAKRVMSLNDTRTWWESKLNEQLTSVSSFIRASGLSTDPKAEGRIAPLVNRINNIRTTMTQLEQTPYFHLGRYGDFFVNFNVRKLGDNVDEKALAAISDYMERKGFGAVVSKASDKSNVFIRVENAAAQANVVAAVRELQRRGLIAKVVNKDGQDQSVKVGRRTDDSIRNTAADDWVTRMTADIEADDTIDAKAKAPLLNALRDYALDLMPENSISRVMTERESIPGYSEDMMRSFDWRAQVGINALAGMSTAPKISRAFTEMRTATNDAQYAAGQGTLTANQANGMQEVTDELSKRESERPLWPRTKVLDQIRAVNHAWFLGASISYGLVNLTQLGATLLPELGSKHGFVEASRAIASATPTALKIVKAVFAEGWDVSVSRAQDAVLTRAALERAGVSGKMAEFIMRVTNTGNLDIGGPARELARAAEGRGDDGIDKVLRYASSIGYYTETATRLIAALATYKLNPSMTAEQASERAAHVLNESMWDYSQSNQGRMFGKQGFLGRFTPLVTAFMQYTAQLTGKLYREAYEATKGDTPQSRREARSYLMQHMAAMTFLAGSLGLPMMTAFAAAFDRLKDLFDDDEEPSNIRAEYRNWLSSVVGTDVEPILSRGALRFFGADISQRVGEADLLPFSKLIADRRKFRDSIKDFQSRSWGAPASMVMNAVEGGEKIAEGDFMGGLARMLPNALSAPAKAYRLASDGNFTDAQGNVLPVETSTRDTLWQLMGFQPASKADYSERRDAEKVVKGQLTRQATVLRSKLVKAIMEGDNARARELITEVGEFDRAHPTMSVLPDVEAAIKRRTRMQAISERHRVPIGVNPADSRYHFGDIEFRAQ